MDIQKQIQFFSLKRLQSYQDISEHYANFLLIRDLSIKIGILEIVTRNKIARLLGITDDTFISSQTLGFWCENISQHKIHNELLNMEHINFKKYSRFNKKDKMRNYQRVEVAYSLFRTLRNRAFHFENLYKQNQNATPRLSTCMIFGRTKVIVGIETDRIESFLDDMLDSFDSELREYAQGRYNNNESIGILCS